MKVDLLPGTYVLAVSGGVDSMALLHAVAALGNKHRFVVAHFDHGIRPDSHQDRQLVAEKSRHYGLPFVYENGNLGPNASEAAARKARYAFLRSVERAANARAIVTAHHSDDVLETAVLNVLRGTYRKGLTSLASRPGLERPLLHMKKGAIIAYAHDHGLTWREDSTNTSTAYARNFVRHKLLAGTSELKKAQAHASLQRLHGMNNELDRHLLHVLHLQDAHHLLDRTMFVRLPHVVAREVMAAWLRNNGVRDFDSRTLLRLVVAGKTYPKGRLAPVGKGVTMVNLGKHLALKHIDRQK